MSLATKIHLDMNSGVLENSRKITFFVITDVLSIRTLVKKINFPPNERYTIIMSYFYFSHTQTIYKIYSSTASLIWQKSQQIFVFRITLFLSKLHMIIERIHSSTFHREENTLSEMNFTRWNLPQVFDKWRLKIARKKNPDDLAFRHHICTWRNRSASRDQANLQQRGTTDALGSTFLMIPISCYLFSYLARR